MEQDVVSQAVGLGTTTDFSLLQLFIRADFVVKFVIILLIASSIYSWALIFEKYKMFKLIEKNADAFEDKFWKSKSAEGFNKTLIENYLKLSSIPIIISGGIKGESDLKEIQSMNDERIYGVILGKSLYEKKINLKTCIKEYGDAG